MLLVVCLSLTNTPQLQYNVMVPHITPSWLRHGTQVSYSGMVHSRIYATSYSHIAAYVPTALHKARYGPTALTLWYHYISTSRLCYNSTLVWLSLTNTPHVCHFFVVYNVRIAGVFIHSSICLAFSHNKLHPLIRCSLSVYCISYT